jgi:LytS/YehU family sensor histidine kinase
VVEVRDDGPGFGEHRDGAVGLENVRKRLHLSYGDEAALRIDSGSRGSTVTMELPQGIPA